MLHDSITVSFRPGETMTLVSTSECITRVCGAAHDQRLADRQRSQTTCLRSVPFDAPRVQIRLLGATLVESALQVAQKRDRSGKIYFLSAAAILHLVSEPPDRSLLEIDS
jgi:hypothetical protein